MTDAELQTVREKLNPYFVPYAQKPKNYKHTSTKKTQPDMWVKDVSKSIVLQVGRLLTWLWFSAQFLDLRVKTLLIDEDCIDWSVADSGTVHCKQDWQHVDTAGRCS